MLIRSLSFKLQHHQKHRIVEPFVTDTSLLRTVHLVPARAKSI